VSKKNKKEKSHVDSEKSRYEYMIAWRERYISKQKEVIEGLEEEGRLLSALLAVSFEALLGEGKGVSTYQEETALCVRIEKEVLRHALDRFSVSCLDGGEAAVLRFTPKAATEEEAEGEAAESAPLAVGAADVDHVAEKTLFVIESGDVEYGAEARAEA
jgi:hypothetical protein